MGKRRESVILVGDIGGTNTRLALVDVGRGPFKFLAEQTFSSREEPSLESALRKFLANPVPPITGAAFGVAGPVRQGRCEATNLPWVIDSRELARLLTLPRVGLINDWEAGAYGIDALGEQRLRGPQSGRPGRAGKSGRHRGGHGIGRSGSFLGWPGVSAFCVRGGSR